MTPIEIAKAWYSVTDRWIDRRNKAHDERQWEVVHDWGGELVSDKKMKVVGRFWNQEAAQTYARTCEDEARGEAVLRALSSE